MKQALLLLLFAVAITLACAWGAKLFYLFVDSPMSDSGVFARDGRLFTYFAWEAPGRTSITIAELERPEGSLALVEPKGNPLGAFEVPAYVGLPAGPDEFQHATGAYGFPWRCLKSDYVVMQPGVAPVDTYPDQLFLSKTFRPQGRAFSLPLGPLWRGMALNTAFWFVLLVACRRVPAKMRARVRRLRGRCPACGYDLLGVWVDGCPECGWGRERNQRLAQPGENRDGS